MNNKVPFSDLINAVADQAGISQQRSHDLLKTIGGFIRDGLVQDGHVYVKNLGTFQLSWQEERPGINPQTDETITIPAHNRVLFRPAGPVQERINQRFSPSEEVDKSVEEPTLNRDRVVESKPDTDGPSDEGFRPWKWIGAAAGIVVIGWVVWMLTHGNEPSEMADDSLPKETVTLAQATPSEIEETVPNQEPAPPASDSASASIREAEESAEMSSEVETSAAQEEPADSAPPVEKPTPPQQPTAEQVTPPTGDTEHVVSSGESLWAIAKEYYGDPLLWPVIYNANKDRIRDPDMIRTGWTLTIPGLKGQPDSLRHDNRILLAECTLSVYQVYQQLDKPGADMFRTYAQRLDPTLSNHEP